MADIVLKGGNTCLKIESEAFRISYITRQNLKVVLGNIGTSQTKTLLSNLASILKGMPLLLTDDSCGMNVVGEPYEGKPHVRFDEGLVETQFSWAPLVYSTARDIDYIYY